MTDDIPDLTDRLNSPYGYFSWGELKALHSEAADSLSRLATLRDEVIEECARVADRYDDGADLQELMANCEDYRAGRNGAAKSIAKAIRGLSRKGEG